MNVTLEDQKNYPFEKLDELLVLQRCIDEKQEDDREKLEKESKKKW